MKFEPTKRDPTFMNQNYVECCKKLYHYFRHSPRDDV